MPTFSVLVPVYNHERYIGAALDSLLAQIDTDWEACVVDDGSTDGSGDIAAMYARSDARIRVFHQPNGGQPVALNSALRAARGEWLCWLSSDDLFLPDKLAVHRQWIARRPGCRYFFTDFELLDGETGARSAGYVQHEPAPGRAVVDLLRHNFICGISICVHRAVFETVGVFDESNKYGQDYDFHLRAVSAFPVVRIPRVTCLHRQHAAQFTRTDNAAMFYDCAAAAIGFLNRSDYRALFPTLDLGDPGVASESLEVALDVAFSADAIVNRLGPHPVLAGRIVEWVWSSSRAIRSLLLPVLLWRLRDAARQGGNDRWNVLWRAMAVFTNGLPRRVSFEPTEVADIAVASYIHQAALAAAEAASLKSYIERRQRRETPHVLPSGHGTRDVLMDEGTSDDTVAQWAKDGWRVTRLDARASTVRIRPWGCEIGTQCLRLPLSCALCVVPPWDDAVGRWWRLFSAHHARSVRGDAPRAPHCDRLGMAVSLLRLGGRAAVRGCVRAFA